MRLSHSCSSDCGSGCVSSMAEAAVDHAADPDASPTRAPPGAGVDDLCAQEKLGSQAQRPRRSRAKPRAADVAGVNPSSTQPGPAPPAPPCAPSPTGAGGAAPHLSPASSRPTSRLPAPPSPPRCVPLLHTSPRRAERPGRAPVSPVTKKVKCPRGEGEGGEGAGRAGIGGAGGIVDWTRPLDQSTRDKTEPPGAGTSGWEGDYDLAGAVKAGARSARARRDVSEADARAAPRAEAAGRPGTFVGSAQASFRLLPRCRAAPGYTCGYTCGDPQSASLIDLSFE